MRWRLFKRESWRREGKNSGLMDQCAAVVSKNAAGERHWVLRGNERNQILEKEGMGILSGVLSECQVFEAEQPGECSAARFP